MDFSKLLDIIKKTPKEQILDKIDFLEKNYVLADIKYALYTVHGPNTIIEEREKRDGQINLRKQVLVRDKSCVITGHNSECCEVSHIKPFYDCNNEEKYDKNNALLLSSSYHKLFVKYYWSINPKTKKIEISNKVVDNSFPIFLYKDKKIKLNEEQLQYMKIHYKEFKRNNK